MESGKWGKHHFRFTFHMFFLVLSTIYYPFSILLFSGCTPSSRMMISGISSSGGGFNSANYVPLISYCDSKQIRWEWDPVVQVMTLEGPYAKGKFLVDSPIGMVDSERVRLSEPMRLNRGSLFFPTSSLDLLESFSMARAPAAVIPSKYQIQKIVLDPGHGGKDPGARGRQGTQEKEIVLDVALRVRDLLVPKGIEVVMTRDRDQFISLGRRAQVANKGRGDFFISLHVNSSTSLSASGFEVYYLSDNIDDESRALIARENVVLDIEEDSFSEHTQSLEATLWDIVNTENRTESSELAKELSRSAHTRLGVRNRGVKSARFAVLKGAMMPAVLIEMGFLTNPHEERKLLSPSYRQRLAEAIAAGILNYKHEYEETEGFSQ